MDRLKFIGLLGPGTAFTPWFSTPHHVMARAQLLPKRFGKYGPYVWVIGFAGPHGQGSFGYDHFYFTDEKTDSDMKQEILFSLN